jgi:hypothetical protein
MKWHPVKVEYVKCEFNKRQSKPNLVVKVGDHTIPQVTHFKYFGSIVQNDWGRCKPLDSSGVATKMEEILKYIMW